MRFMRILAGAMASLMLASVAAFGQGAPSTRALVVPTCGAQSFPLTVGGQAAYAPLTILQNGQLCGSSTGGGGGGSVTQGTSPWVDNISQFGGSAVVTGTGASGAGIPRVTVSSDSTILLGGMLPAFAATPTFNLGALNGAATAANQTAVQAAPGTSATTAEGVQGVTGGLPVVTAEAGSAAPAAGITASQASAATALLGKASAGNLYSTYATNLTTLAGYLVSVNLATPPTSGTAITPVECIPLAASPTGNAGITYGAGPPDAYSAGQVTLLSTSCTTYTPSTMSGFIKTRMR